MAWETENVTSNFDAKSYTTNQIAGREGLRSGAIGGYKNGTSFGGEFHLGQEYSIVGMDITQVQKAREAISQYVSNIENHVNNIDALADANGAYKGEEVQTAVKNYVDKVKEYCINLCSQLRAFSDKLADARTAWEAAMGNMASTIDSSTGSFSAGTKYTEQR